MQIRQEEKKDRAQVYPVIQAAFASAEHSDGHEQDLVEALRKSEAFIPALSLVAERDGQIVGHILFTKIRIGNKSALALAPLAVSPDCQRQGVGQALIERGHEIARQLGYGCSVVMGSAQYYPKFGYRPADCLGIRAPFEVPPENFMAQNLQGGAEQWPGTVEYAKEFFMEF